MGNNNGERHNGLETLGNKNKPTKHHIISQCQGDLFNVLRYENKTILDDRSHQALHQFFTDEHGYIHQPRLQLERFFTVIQPILSDKIRQKLQAIINTPDCEFYKKELIKNLQ